MDPVPGDAPGAVEIAFAVPARYNASALLYDNLPLRAGKVAVLCGERRRHLRRALRACRPRRQRNRAHGARPRRPRADAARRRARVRGGDLRRDPRGLRAGPRQHAVAAGTRGVPAAGHGRRGRACRRALRGAAGARGRRGEPAAPRRARRRHRGTRGPGAGNAPRLERVGRRAGRDARARGHAPRRHGVLDVQLGLHRAAQGRGPPAARRAVHARRVRPRRHRHRPGRRRVLAAARSSSRTASATR